MHPHSLQKRRKRRKLFEKRLLELHQLSEAGRLKLHEAWREQSLLLGPQEAKQMPPKLASQLGALEARILELKEQTQRLREHIHSFSALKELFPPKEDE